MPPSSGSLASSTARPAEPHRSGGQVRDAAHAGATVEGQHPSADGSHVIEPSPSAGSARRRRSAPVQLEHRLRFAVSASTVSSRHSFGCGSHGTAGAPGGVKPNGGSARPWQRYPAAVPARVGAAGSAPDRVLAQLVGDVLHFPQAELLALVDVDRAWQGQREQRRRPARRVPSCRSTGSRGSTGAAGGRRRCPPGRTWTRSGPRHGWTAPRSPGRRPAVQGQRLVDDLAQRGGRPRGSSGTGS